MESADQALETREGRIRRRDAKAKKAFTSLVVHAKSRCRCLHPGPSSSWGRCHIYKRKQTQLRRRGVLRSILDHGVIHTSLVVFAPFHEAANTTCTRRRWASGLKKQL